MHDNSRGVDIEIVEKIRETIRALSLREYPFYLSWLYMKNLIAKERLSIIKLQIKAAVITSLIAILVLILVGFGKSVIKSAKIKQDMAEYIENTYGISFVVEKPRVMWNTGFGYIQHVAKAYPKDDKNLKFVVRWNKNTLEFDDNYQPTKWSKQGTKEMENKLKEVYGEHFKIKSYKVYYSNKELKNMDYKDIINKYAYGMRLDLHYYVFLDGDLDKEYEAQRAYKIIKENFIDIDPTEELQYFFAVVYIKKGKKIELDDLYSKTSEGDGERGPSNLYKLGILEDWIRITYSPNTKEENPKIVSADQIKNAFRIGNDNLIY